MSNRISTVSTASSKLWSFLLFVYLVIVWKEGNAASQTEEIQTIWLPSGVLLVLFWKAPLDWGRWGMLGSLSGAAMLLLWQGWRLDQSLLRLGLHFMEVMGVAWGWKRWQNSPEPQLSQWPQIIRFGACGLLAGGLTTWALASWPSALPDLGRLTWQGWWEKTILDWGLFTPALVAWFQSLEKSESEPLKPDNPNLPSLPNPASPFSPQALMSILPDSVFSLERQGKVLQVALAPEDQAFLGALKEGTPWEALELPASFKQTLLYGVQRACERQALETHEYELKVNGQGRFYEVRLVPAASEQVVCLLRDMTARRLAEKQALENLKELRRSHSALDDFVHIAAHDLKEPLRGIHGYAEILLEDYKEKLDEEGQFKLQRLKSLAENMGQLIEGLQSYSRINKAELEIKSLDLNEVLQKTLELFQHTLESQHIEVRVPRALPAVSCDRAMVSQVLNNLLTNAIKYNDKAQKWVEVGSQTRAESQAQQLQPGDSEPIFYVRDNGIGIAEQHLQAVFRLFRRLHPRHKFGGGTGAGLTLTQKMIERHGGRIWVESTPGEGSTFYFTLSGNREDAPA